MKSEFDDRDTVGTTYVKSQVSIKEKVTVGDLNTEMLTGLMEDINDAAQSNPFEGRPFYINVAEKRDLQMKNAFRRKIIKTLYRPFPEFSTYVLKMTPKKQEICCCGDLPNHSDMINNYAEYIANNN